MRGIEYRKHGLNTLDLPRKKTRKKGHSIKWVEGAGELESGGGGGGGGAELDSSFNGIENERKGKRSLTYTFHFPFVVPYKGYIHILIEPTMCTTFVTCCSHAYQNKQHDSGKYFKWFLSVELKWLVFGVILCGWKVRIYLNFLKRKFKTIIISF